MIATQWENVSLAGAFIVGFIAGITACMRMFRIVLAERDRAPVPARQRRQRRHGAPDGNGGT